MIRVPVRAAKVARYVARVERVGGRRRRWLELKLWCANHEASRPLIEARCFGAVDPAGDLRAEAVEAVGVTTFRGDVARVGAAVEVVTFSLDEAERMVIAPATASSPRIATEGRP